MSTPEVVRVAMIGCGGFARHHLRAMFRQQDTTRVIVGCEPSAEQWAQTVALFEDSGLEPPPNQPDLDRLLADYGDQLDAAFIITPHVFHHDQACACLTAGLDVLLEKPMVMNAAEARSLIDVRDRAGKLLVVAFPGSLSPQVRTAVRMLRAGDLGEVLSISAVVWQNWDDFTDFWRGDPAMSGGGFMFDTGAHVLNTVADLAGEDFAEVAAWQDHRDKKVDILSAIMARLESGVMVTIHGCGATIRTCASDIRVFGTEGIIRTGMWGECLEWQRDGEPALEPVPVPESLGAWQQFLAVRAGKIANPCPPQVGLRMARLWDAIKASAAQNGNPVSARTM